MDTNQAAGQEAEESKMIVELVAKFVDQELMPLEAGVLSREIAGEHCALTKSEEELAREVQGIGFVGLGCA